MHDPELIVLDEPFSGLDPVNSNIIRDVIMELVEKGKYIIMSSHQMNSVEEFCEDIVILNRGKTVVKGNLTEIKESYPVNKVEIDTKEDIEKFIKGDSLKITKHTGKKYVIEFGEEKKADEILKTLVENNIKIEKYELIRPTLHEIFVEKVGENK